MHCKTNQQSEEGNLKYKMTNDNDNKTGTKTQNDIIQQMQNWTATKVPPGDGREKREQLK